MFIKRKKGFTVVEVMVAAAIFALFSGALFSIYRMGSRMFVSGSWKYTRQKEAERFFEILKERIEQASVPVKISTDSSEPKLDKSFFVCQENGYEVTLPAKESIQLAEFAVCKPDMSALILENDEEDEKSRKRGLALFHSICVVPSKGNNLYELHLKVDKDLNDANYFNKLEKSCLTWNILQFDDFKNTNYAVFSLAPVPATFKLVDVATVTVSIAQGEATGENIKPSIFGLKVGMVNPKHDKTILEMSFKAKIDGAVEL